MPQTISPGDLVEVLPHHLEGYAWTVGAVGSIKCQSHEKDFDIRGTRQGVHPSVRPGWWTVSVDHPKARKGYAFARLPEEHLAPHTCVDSCPTHHPCQAG